MFKKNANATLVHRRGYASSSQLKKKETISGDLMEKLKPEKPHLLWPLKKGSWPKIAISVLWLNGPEVPLLAEKEEC